MKNTRVTLVPLEADDREQFILDNQWAFKYGAIEEFGERDNHLDFDGEIISRKTIERSIDSPDSETYRIVVDGRKVGGVILKINKETNRNELEILFVSPEEHTKGIGYGAWLAIEALHPETVVWETCTPYFEKRNMEVKAEIMIPFIRTMPISKPILIVIKSNARSPAIVVNALAETGFITSFIAEVIAFSEETSFSFALR